MLEKQKHLVIPIMTPHHVRARQLRDEYERISGERPPYPRSKVALEQLRTALEELQREVPSGKPAPPAPSTPQVPSKTQRLEFERSKWVVGRYLRGWEVVVPQGHSLSADPKSFLEGVRPQVMLKLKEVVAALQGIKF